MRLSALGSRFSALAAALTIASCTGEKPGADSVDAAAQRDSMSARPAETAAAETRADTAANPPTRGSAKTVNTNSSSKASDSATSKTKILGRDSVRQGPIIGVPSIVDTAKRRPPL